MHAAWGVKGTETQPEELAGQWRVGRDSGDGGGRGGKPDSGFI